MRKLSVLAVGVLALSVSGLAVGMGLHGSKTAKLVAGTFTATTASQTFMRTCTTQDGKTWTPFLEGRYRRVVDGETLVPSPQRRPSAARAVAAAASAPRRTATRRRRLR